MAESDWSACPHEILVQYYFDNKAADATCKAWHDAMLGVAEFLAEIPVCDGPIGCQTPLLHKFPNLLTVKIVQADDIQHDDIRQRTMTLPLSCTYLTLGQFRHAGTVSPLDQLSTLQELHFQTAWHPMISFASLTSLKKLLVLTVAGDPQERENVMVTGSIVDLPRGITQLQFRHCSFHDASAQPPQLWSPIYLSFASEASHHFSALQYLDLSSLAVDVWGNFADMRDLVTLVLEGSTVWVTADLTFLHAAPALHTLNIHKATLKCQHSLFGISHVLAAASSLKHLDVTHCLDLLIRYTEILQASAQLTALICSHCDLMLLILTTSKLLYTALRPEILCRPRKSLCQRSCLICALIGLYT